MTSRRKKSFSANCLGVCSSPEFKKTQISHRVWDFLKRRTHDKKISGRGRVQAEEKSGPGEQLDEKMQSLIFGPGKAEIGLGTAIFGISVKNYRGYRNSRPNPLLGGLFRGRLKISILDMVISNRKPCLIIQSEPLCENCPTCRNSKPLLGNFRTQRTERQFLEINTVGVFAHMFTPSSGGFKPMVRERIFRNAVLGSTKLWAPTVGAGATFLEGDLR